MSIGPDLQIPASQTKSSQLPPPAQSRGNSQTPAQQQQVVQDRAPMAQQQPDQPFQKKDSPGQTQPEQVEEVEQGQVKRKPDRSRKRPRSPSTPTHECHVKVQVVPTAAQEAWQREHGAQEQQDRQAGDVVASLVQTQPYTPVRESETDAVSPVDDQSLNVNPTNTAVQVTGDSASDALGLDPAFLAGEWNFSNALIQGVPLSTGVSLPRWIGPPHWTSLVGANLGEQTPSQLGSTLQFNDDPFVSASATVQQVEPSPAPSRRQSLAPRPAMQAPGRHFIPQHPQVEKLRQEAQKAKPRQSQNGDDLAVNNAQVTGPGTARTHHEALKTPIQHGDTNTSGWSRKRPRLPSLKVRENEVAEQETTSPTQDAVVAGGSSVKIPKMKAENLQVGKLSVAGQAAPSKRRKPKGEAEDAEYLVRDDTSNMRGGGRARNKEMDTSYSREGVVDARPHVLAPSLDIIDDARRAVWPDASGTPAGYSSLAAGPVSSLLAPSQAQAQAHARARRRPRSDSLSSRRSRDLPPQLPKSDVPEAEKRFRRLGFSTFQSLDDDGNIEHRVVTRTGKPDGSVGWWLDIFLSQVAAASCGDDGSLAELVLALIRVRDENEVPKIVKRVGTRELVLHVIPGPEMRLVPTERYAARRDSVSVGMAMEQGFQTEYGTAALTKSAERKSLLQETGWDALLREVEAKARAMRACRRWRGEGTKPDQLSWKRDAAAWMCLEARQRRRSRGVLKDDSEGGQKATALVEENNGLGELQLRDWRQREGDEGIRWMTKTELDKVILPDEVVRSRPGQVEMHAGKKTTIHMVYARFLECARAEQGYDQESVEGESLADMPTIA